jgi:arylmalonate decarboxylase
MSDLLALSGATGGSSAPGTPTVGLVVPPAHGRVPADAGALYPEGVRFVAGGLGLRTMTPADYARALTSLDGVVHGLVAGGAEAVSLMGTSLSFFRGADGAAELLERLRTAAGGLRVSTMAAAAVRALHHLGVSRVAVGAAYTGQVTDRLVEFLGAHDVEVVARAELHVTHIDRLDGVDTAALTELTERLLGPGPPADAVLLSCGGLDTLTVIPDLEDRWGLPVVSSSQAGFWDAVQLVRPGIRADHPGLLFAA